MASAAALVAAAQLPSVVTVDYEDLLVIGVSSNTLTVIRGWNGTVATTHDDGSTVRGLINAHAWNNVVDVVRGDTVLHLHLESSGADSSAYNATPTAIGSPTFSTGKWGNGLVLNGSSQYVTYPNAACYNVGYGDFFIEGWLNIGAADYSAKAGRMVSFGGDVTGTSYEWTLGVGYNAGWGAGTRMNFACHTGNGLFEFSSPAAITMSTATWYHWALSRHGSVLGLFWNGQRLGQRSFPYRFGNETALMVVGCRADGMSYIEYFKGTLDEILFARGTAGGFVGSTYTIPAGPYA